MHDKAGGNGGNGGNGGYGAGDGAHVPAAPAARVPAATQAAEPTTPRPDPDGVAPAPDAVPDGPDARLTGAAPDDPARQAAEFLAHVLDGGTDREPPPAGGLPGLAAPLLTAQAAALADGDLAGAATVLTQGLADHDPADFAGLLDLDAVVPALCARVARAKRRDGRGDALVGIVRAQAAALLQNAGNAPPAQPLQAAATHAVTGAVPAAATTSTTGVPQVTPATSTTGVPQATPATPTTGVPHITSITSITSTTGVPHVTPTTTALKTLAHCATALGDHPTADDLWQRLLEAVPAGPEVPEHAQYGAYLCHRAVIAHEAGDTTAAFALLRRAARHLPPDHPVHRQLTDLDRDDRMDALLAALFPGAVPGFERRGRYRVIEEAAALYPALWNALERDRQTAILRELATLLDIGDPDDLTVAHTLAVLHREEALAALARAGVPGPELGAATALWALLLAHPAFWRHAGIDDEEAAAELRRDLTDELLTLHRTHGARALDAGRTDDFAAQLRALRAVREGPGATRALLAGGPLAAAVPDGVEPELFAGAAKRAGRLVDDWAADLVRTATERVDDPAAVEALPVGVDRDYEAGIALLDAAIRQGFAPVPVLTAVLEWHNQWQFGLYRLSDWDAVRAVLVKAIPYADRLAEQCATHRPHLKENQVLGFHFLERGLLNGRNVEAVRFLEQAQEWDPGNQEVDRFLDSRRKDLVFIPVREHNTEGRYDEALALLDEIPDTEEVHKTHVQLRVNALYGKGKRELKERDFDVAERCLREVLVLAPEVTDDPKLVPDTNQALSALLNNRAVVFINAANNAPAGDTEALLGLVAARPLLREAIDFNPANKTAAENLTRAEEMTRRFLR